MKKLLLLIILTVVSCSSPENPNAIKGLEPYDIYGNFEKHGYETTKNITTDGSLWTSTQNNAAGQFVVTAYSSDVNSVESIRATATIGPNQSIEAARQFMKFTASFPYEGANPDIAISWVDKNFNNSKDTIIGGVKMSLNAPSKLVRVLLLEKAK